MRKDDPSKIRAVYVGLNPEEYSRFEHLYKATTCRTMSHFIRCALFNKKITTLYRNQSLDDLIEELVVVNEQINTIRSTIEQLVIDLHSHPQIDGFAAYMESLECEIRKHGKKISQIKKQIEKVTQKWLQS